MQYDEQNADEFLDRVEDITKRVEDILAGNTDVIEEEARMQDEAKMRERKQEIKEREAAERLAKGQPGKGYKGNFKSFCKGCHTEYHHAAVEVCNNCGRETTSHETRMAELRDRLEEHKIKKAKKLERRAKWENWKKTQEMFYRKTSTNYAKWDVFESESEEEIPEDEKEPIVPENDPAFKAMEADFNDRAKKRKRNRKEANRLKDLGNDCMKRGLYKSANHHYSKALDEIKDMLPLYTNRALARIRLEMWQDVVDDCTRVLEYCEVFDDGYTKQRDLCYKALSRRGQAFRALNDFDEAIKDLCMAKVLLPDQADCQRLIDQYKQDKEHARRIAAVMENAQELAGRDYVEHLLNAVQGKIPQTLSQVAAGEPTKADQKQLPRYCQHAITPEEAKKLKSILKKEEEELVLYFNAKDGFRTLVQSLEYNTECLDLLRDLVVDNDQLRDDFQRNHQYEALIDFMYKKNVNAEGATLSAENVHIILQILENGSMNEAVRMNLSEKKKVKDLFLVVIKAIDVDENRQVVSSLIQFASNLCYGTGKFRRLLIASEAPNDFIKTISSILSSCQKPIDLAAAVNAAVAEENKTDNLLSNEGNRVLLKGTTLNFIGNLCVENQLRQHIAQDMGGLLSQVFESFAADVKQKPFEWVDSSSRALQTLVNCSLEASAQTLLAAKPFDKAAETIFKTIALRPEREEEKELVLRTVQLLSRLVKVRDGQQKIANSKDLMLKLLVYYSQTETNKSALITIHTLCSQVNNLRETLLDTHKFTLASFDSFVSTAIANFKRTKEGEMWDEYQNCCSSVTGFIGCFPERAIDFQELIVPLIDVCSNKTDRIRRNSAVLMARLAQDEANKRVMTANHGTEVLMSLQGQLL